MKILNFIFCNVFRPLFITDSHNFDIKQGRHPVVVKLMGEENQFVANDVNLNVSFVKVIYGLIKFIDE